MHPPRGNFARLIFIIRVIINSLIMSCNHKVGFYREAANLHSWGNLLKYAEISDGLNRMTNKTEDPRRVFLIRALSMGLFASTGIAQILQQSHAMGEIPRQLPDGR